MKDKLRARWLKWRYVIISYRTIDLLIAITITIVDVALVFALPSTNVIGRILTLPLVLVLPGYALTCALFPKRALGILQCVVFSLALSLGIVILGGLALNWMPFGLHTRSWSVLLSGITLIASTVALIRRRGQYISASAWLRVDLGLNVRQGLLLGLAAIVVCGAGAVSYRGAAQQPFPGFTQLWILPADGASVKNTIRLGVSNMELTAMEYNLSVNMDGKVVKVWPSIYLKLNEKWEVTLVLPHTTLTHTAKVEALLYQTKAPTKIYRHVVLWLDMGGEAP
jgi:uncharacterized membrane protein